MVDFKTEVKEPPHITKIQLNKKYFTNEAFEYFKNEGIHVEWSEFEGRDQFVDVTLESVHEIHD